MLCTRMAEALVVPGWSLLVVDCLVHCWLEVGGCCTSFLATQALGCVVIAGTRNGLPFFPLCCSTDARRYTGRRYSERAAGHSVVAAQTIANNARHY